MILAEPPPTQADLHFRLFGIPVRVHPFFWLVAALLGLRGTEGDPVLLLLWVVAVFFSILVHELGHAFAARAHGWPSRITLHSFGGLASYQPTYHSSRSQILIALAGPMAGFALAAVVLIAIRLTGHRVWFEPSLIPVRFSSFDAANLNELVSDLLFINILWGLVNLLPVFPLDGGQIAREVLSELQPHDGLRNSLWLSVFCGGALAATALAYGQLYVAILFGLLAWSSYSSLQASLGRGGGRGW